MSVLLGLLGLLAPLVRWVDHWVGALPLLQGVGARGGALLVQLNAFL
jgi:hypothetical protein